MLEIALLNVSGRPNGFMNNIIPAWRLWYSENWRVKINGRYDEFLLLKENILSMQSVLLFLTCYQRKYKKVSLFFYWILLKLLEKLAVQIKLFSIPFTVCNTAWKVSKYGVFPGPYLSVFSPNAGKYGSEKAPYLDTFHAV